MNIGINLYLCSVELKQKEKMREIKFRGKKVDTGEWVIGLYDNYQGKSYINQEDYSDGVYSHYSFEVIPETVCQYTGAKDIRDVEIYEGDITSNGTAILWDDNKHLFAEYYKNKYSGNYTIACIPADFSRVSIISNIYDNPELLK